MASPSKKVAMPQSIIDQYAKYQNKLANIKTQVMMGTKFEVPDRYEIIDTSSYFFFTKKHYKNTLLLISSWSRRLRSRGGSQG